MTMCFGSPAVEAQHCNCPVIVSNRGSMPEIVGKNAVMLDPADTGGWVETVALVLDDTSLRNTMIATGQEQAKKFNWEKTARNTMAIYHEQL